MLVVKNVRSGSDQREARKSSVISATSPRRPSRPDRAARDRNAAHSGDRLQSCSRPTPLCSWAVATSGTASRLVKTQT